MNIRRGLQTFGTLGLAKSWNEEDHPRDDDGQFSSTGGGGGSDDGDDEEYGPGEGYEPKDQERHDKAQTTLLTHVIHLQDSLDRASTVFHDKSATADQIAAAAKEVREHREKAASAHDEVNAVRALYSDEEHETGILNSTEDLSDALDSYESALTTIRGETAGRAAFVAQIAASRHDDAITQLERDLESASNSMAARRAALRSKPA